MVLKSHDFRSTPKWRRHICVITHCEYRWSIPPNNTRNEGFLTSIFDGIALKISTIIVLFLCEITFIVATIQFSQFSLNLLLFCQPLATSCSMYVEILREILVLSLLKETLLIKELKPILNDFVSSEKLISLHLL